MKPLIKIRCLFIMLSVVMATSCNTWLEVEPIDKMSEDKLFSTEEGFRQALNGIYLDMISNDLYGSNLSCTFIEVLAQRYNVETGGHSYLKVSDYSYTDDRVKGIVDAIWQKAYYLIANCNYLLMKAEENKTIFTADNYNLICGEAYALRAYLHFDALRLWGPMYGADTKKQPSIPYYVRKTTAPEPLLTAEEVIDKVLADLDMAEQLLAKDPVKGSSPAYSTYRNLTLNWYAVRAFRARVYLYADFPDKAYVVAQRLLADNAFKNAFPFIKKNYIADTKNPDRLFYSEQLFCIENQNRGELYSDWFDPQLDDNTFLGPSASAASSLFIDPDDIRKIYWNLVPSGGKTAALAKFENVSESDGLLSPRIKCQSFIRLGEVYLIAAEAGLEVGMETEAIRFMNTFLEERGYLSDYIKNTTQLKDIIAGEYSREFYGEGQYFFYLKRKRVSPLTSGLGGKTIEMDEQKYVLSLPDSETKYRNN